jgi:hypothetical protein
MLGQGNIGAQLIFPIKNQGTKFGVFRYFVDKTKKFLRTTESKN